MKFLTQIIVFAAGLINLIFFPNVIFSQSESLIIIVIAILFVPFELGMDCLVWGYPEDYFSKYFKKKIDKKEKENQK